APDLRLSPLGSLRPRARHRVIRHRRCCRRAPRLFRRVDRSSLPEVHRHLDLGAAALPPDHRLILHRAELLRPARHPPLVLLGVARRRGARRIPAGPQFRICARGSRTRLERPQDHAQTRAAERHGGDAHLPALHPQRLDLDLDLARFPRLWPAAGLALARRASQPGQIESSGALARAFGLHRDRDHAVAPDLYRGGRARRLRPEKRRVSAMRNYGRNYGDSAVNSREGRSSCNPPIKGTVTVVPGVLRVYLDANVLIRMMERTDAAADASARLFSI